MPGWGISYGNLYRGGCQTKGCQAGRFHTGCYTDGDVRLSNARLGDFIRDVIQRGMSGWGITWDVIQRGMKD